MMYRIIPNKSLPIGARKHFALSFAKSEATDEEISEARRILRKQSKGAILSGLSYLIITSVIIYILWINSALTPGAILLLVLIYSVLDLLFILFFCPLKHLFMKNRCCSTCRIYNWDCLMICLPLIIFPSIYSIVLVAMAVIVFLRWEIALWRNPHFFVDKINENLSCAKCDNAICVRKTRHGGM